jgi:AcrR family transcriptional regulator
MSPAVIRPPLRDKILDAADRLLGRLGYRKTTLDDLAREAGIGRRTIYLYFPSKEEIFFASIDRVVERMLESLRKAAVVKEPASERLRKMLATRVLSRFDSVRDYYQSIDELLGVLRAGYLERREGYFEAEARVFAEVIALGVAQGELDCPDPEVAAQAMIRATNSLLPYSLSARELGSRRDVERSVEELSDLVLRGLLARGTEAASPATAEPALVSLRASKPRTSTRKT